ncbi:hypothetical protein BSKO_05218 [Bryopsis sp. KO-2023]|nr:hypothetical protein BSKO_05218 [Bryopsis sp. KO-2023]
MSQDWDPKFPEGPPANYDPERPFADKEAMIEMREYVVRRKAIDMEKAKILKERVRECYLREGVNHLQNCKELADRYMKSIKNANYGRGDSGPNAQQNWQKGKFVFE